ncbi:MAG: hypothetical protein ACF8QF_01640, partial [Phycisphaerales bacterium]
MHARPRFVAAVAALLLSLLLPSRAAAQDVWLAFELSDPSALVSHPKDAGLREALALLPDRLLEVAEMTGAGAEIDQVRPLMPLIGAPMRLAITGAQPEEEGAPPVIGLVMISSQADRADAQGLIDMLEMVLGMQGMLVEGEAGAIGPESLALMTPMGPGSAGVVERNGRFDATLVVGDVGENPFATLPAAEGRAIMRMRVDSAAASWFTTPLLENLIDGDVGNTPSDMAFYRVLTGENAPVFEGVLSRSADAMQLRISSSKIRPNAQAWSIHEGGLTDADLRAIPANGAMGGMAALDLTSAWDEMAVAMEAVPEAGEFLEQLRELTGLDLRDDVLPALGPAFGFYSSVAGVTDATPTGLTFVLGVRDAAAVRQFLDSLAEAGNQVIEDGPPSSNPIEESLRHTRIAMADDAGARWWSVEIPGMPLPFFPTVALTDQHLIVSFSKTAARGAVAQATGRGDAGMGSRPEVQRLAAGTAPVRLFYLDTPALAPMAYPYVDWLLTALASGVSSPHSDHHVALPAIPPYDEWKANVRPLTSVTVWEGDALVQHAEMDGSLLTTMAGGALGMAQSGGGVAMLAGILAPALERARDNAMALHEGAQVKLLHTACVSYAAQHGGDFPDDLSVLVEEGFIQPEDLQSPYGPVWDGGPDYFLKPGARDSLDAGELQLYSRAQMAAEGRTNVACGDNYVLLVTMDQFFE